MVLEELPAIEDNDDEQLEPGNHCLNPANIYARNISRTYIHSHVKRLSTEHYIAWLNSRAYITNSNVGHLLDDSRFGR